MTATATCPTCGVGFDRDDQDAAERAVVSHMSSKTDDEHKGIGYQKAWNLLKLNSDASGNSDEQGTGTSDSDIPDNQDASGNHGNPTMDEGPPSVPVCPDCESEDYYLASEVLRKFSSELTESEREGLRKHDRVCEGCGEVYST